MAKIFELELIVRMLPLVRAILADLEECSREFQEALDAPGATDSSDHDAQLRLLEIQRDIRRHRADLEQLGCYLGEDAEANAPVLLFPSIQGGRMGFFTLQAGEEELEGWTPADALPVERPGMSASSARRKS